MTHLRRCDIASVKCRLSIFYVDNVTQQRYIRKHFRHRCVAIIDMPLSCERGPVLGGRRERLQDGPGQPAAAHPFLQGSVRNPDGRSRKSLLFRPIQKIRLATADRCAHQKSCHTGEGRCPWQNWVPAFAGKTRKKASQGRARHLPPLGPYAVSKASLDMLVKIYAGEVVVASAVSSRPNV
jgi:hypothetical protein